MSKLISSDGLSSSSQSTATSSTVSSDFQPPEVVYKPEFVKFLDSINYISFFLILFLSNMSSLLGIIKELE
jgi:hypothetical protein